jgi:hypothetical protein
MIVESDEKTRRRPKKLIIHVLTFFPKGRKTKKNVCVCPCPNRFSLFSFEFLAFALVLFPSTCPLSFLMHTEKKNEEAIDLCITVDDGKKTELFVRTAGWERQSL